MSALAERDMALAVAWADGELDARAATAFELRLADDPELAEAVEAFLATDALLRRQQATAADAGGGGRRQRIHQLGKLLAVAAVVLLAVGVFLDPFAGEPLAFGVLDARGDWHGLPPAPATRSGDPGADAAAMRDWYAGYAEAEQAASEQALEQQAEAEVVSLPEADQLLAVVALEEAADVLLLLRAEGGPLVAAHPPLVDDAAGPVRLEAGRHLLPSASWRLTDSPFGGDVPLAVAQDGLTLGGPGPWELLLLRLPAGRGEAARGDLTGLGGLTPQALLERLRAVADRHGGSLHRLRVTTGR